MEARHARHEMDFVSPPSSPVLSGVDPPLGPLGPVLGDGSLSDAENRVGHGPQVPRERAMPQADGSQAIITDAAFGHVGEVPHQMPSAANAQHSFRAPLGWGSAPEVSRPSTLTFDRRIRHHRNTTRATRNSRPHSAHDPTQRNTRRTAASLRDLQAPAEQDGGQTRNRTTRAAEAWNLSPEWVLRAFIKLPTTLGAHAYLVDACPRDCATDCASEFQARRKPLRPQDGCTPACIGNFAITALHMARPTLSAISRSSGGVFARSPGRRAQRPSRGRLPFCTSSRGRRRRRESPPSKSQATPACTHAPEQRGTLER